MGLDGFEFVEFASRQPNVLEPVFEMLGYSKIATHHSKRVSLYRQGGRIRIPFNEEASQGAGQVEVCLMAYNGEGNFKALFESIERDQVRRGIIDREPDGSRNRN